MTASPGSHDGDVGLPDYVGGWMAHGHPGYHGYAWYRRAVTVPSGSASWDILGPTLVEDGYELYWNGQRLGGSGRLGPSPRVVVTRPDYGTPPDFSKYLFPIRWPPAQRFLVRCKSIRLLYCPMTARAQLCR